MLFFGYVTLLLKALAFSLIIVESQIFQMGPVGSVLLPPPQPYLTLLATLPFNCAPAQTHLTQSLHRGYIPLQAHGPLPTPIFNIFFLELNLNITFSKHSFPAAQTRSCLGFQPACRFVLSSAPAKVFVRALSVPWTTLCSPYQTCN